MQTTYSTIPDPSFQGMLADDGPKDVLSKAYDVTAAANGPAQFGVAMAQGDTDETCQLPDEDNELIIGVAAHRFIAPGTPGTELFTGQQGIEDTQTVDVLTKGRIWVLVEEAVTPKSAVAIRHTANGAGKLVLGAFRTDIDGGNADLVASGMAFRSTTTGAGLAVLEVNGPIVLAAT